jgi:hypothetical protein
MAVPNPYCMAAVMPKSGYAEVRFSPVQSLLWQTQDWTYGPIQVKEGPVLSSDGSEPRTGPIYTIFLASSSPVRR